MAEASSTPKQANKVPHAGDHDRVQMLSVKADGTLDQHNPEIIGDKGFAVDATKRQFAEQAVSAVDVAERGAASGAVTIVGTSGDGPDKVIPATTDATGAQSELQKKQEAAQKAAEAAAEAVVESLSQD